MSGKVAVVTGSNKGIGLGIVRGLCTSFDGDVILTSRDISRGQEAIKQLQTEGLKPKLHALDISNATSIEKLKDFLIENYGGIDVLVNNAGVLYRSLDTPFVKTCEDTMKTNFFDTLNVNKIMFPCLKKGARVVNLSSSIVCLVNTCSEKIQKQLKSPQISMSELEAIMKQYIQAAKNNTIKEEGFSPMAYAMSKIAVTVMTEIQQRTIDSLRPGDGILVNSVDPGSVATDMNAGRTDPLLSVEQGAAGPISLALISQTASQPKGAYMTEQKIVEWRDMHVPDFFRRPQSAEDKTTLPV